MSRATARVRLAEKYNEYADRGVRFGLVRKEDANLDSYVTQKALDGLFLVIADEEKEDSPGSGRVGLEHHPEGVRRAALRGGAERARTVQNRARPQAAQSAASRKPAR